MPPNRRTGARPPVLNNTPATQPPRPSRSIPTLAPSTIPSTTKTFNFESQTTVRNPFRVQKPALPPSDQAESSALAERLEKKQQWCDGGQHADHCVFGEQQHDRGQLKAGTARGFSGKENQTKSIADGATHGTVPKKNEKVGVFTTILRHIGVDSSGEVELAEEVSPPRRVSRPTRKKRDMLEAAEETGEGMSSFPLTESQKTTERAAGRVVVDITSPEPSVASPPPKRRRHSGPRPQPFEQEGDGASPRLSTRGSMFLPVKAQETNKDNGVRLKDANRGEILDPDTLADMSSPSQQLIVANQRHNATSYEQDNPGRVEVGNYQISAPEDGNDGHQEAGQEQQVVYDHWDDNKDSQPNNHEDNSGGGNDPYNHHYRSDSSQPPFRRCPRRRRRRSTSSVSRSNSHKRRRTSPSQDPRAALSSISRLSYTLQNLSLTLPPALTQNDYMALHSRVQAEPFLTAYGKAVVIRDLGEEGMQGRAREFVNLRKGEVRRWWLELGWEDGWERGLFVRDAEEDRGEKDEDE